MAAFAASVLSLIIPAIRNRLFRQADAHSCAGIPLPASPHIVIPQETVNRFDEVVVIGDVHGCFDELTQLLDLIHKKTSIRENGTEAKILKLFTGDLVNKGPKSREVIQFLLQNEFRHSYVSVRGNHDDEVIDQVLNYVRKDRPMQRARNKWMQDVTDEEVRFLMELPYSIAVPSLNAVVVHAGLVPGVPVQDISPTDLISMRNVIREGSGYKASQSHKEGEAWAKCWPGPAHVYFGHDAVRMLQKEAHATGLDTGCVYGKELTALFIKGPRKGEFISVKAKHVYQSIPIKSEN